MAALCSIAIRRNPVSQQDVAHDLPWRTFANKTVLVEDCEGSVAELADMLVGLFPERGLKLRFDTRRAPARAGKAALLC